jgi:hypothetical protein
MANCFIVNFVGSNFGPEILMIKYPNPIVKISVGDVYEFLDIR